MVAKCLNLSKKKKKPLNICFGFSCLSLWSSDELLSWLKSRCSGFWRRVKCYVSKDLVASIFRVKSYRNNTRRHKTRRTRLEYSPLCKPQVSLPFMTAVQLRILQREEFLEHLKEGSVLW